MTPLNQAWDILKDFYFDGASNENTESGVWRPDWLPKEAAGAKGLDPSLPQNQAGFYGFNLGQQGQGEQAGQSAFKTGTGEWESDEDLFDRIKGTLGHESVHSAQDSPLMEASGIKGGNPFGSGTEEQQFQDFMTAHEYGATSGTSDDMTNAALDFSAHPQVMNNPVKEQLADQRYSQLATTPMPPSTTQGMRSQMNALQGLGVPQTQVQQSMAQGNMPQQQYQQLQQVGPQ